VAKVGVPAEETTHRAGSVLENPPVSRSTVQHTKHSGAVVVGSREKITKVSCPTFFAVFFFWQTTTPRVHDVCPQTLCASNLGDRAVVQVALLARVQARAAEEA
jgi:hypothetical protein